MKSHFLNLCQYEYWANQKVYESTLQLPEIPERANELLSHILAAQNIWYSRLAGIPEKFKVWEKIPSEKWLETLKENTTKLYDFVNNLTESRFSDRITYKNSQGDAFDTAIQDVLSHLLLHSTYHRGQIIILIKPFTNTVFASDYIFYHY